MKDNFEIPSSFQIGTVCFWLCINGAAIFIPCATVQCIVLTYSCSVIHGLLHMYEAATTDNRLKNQSYIDVWPVSLQLVEFHSKDRSPTAKMALLLLTR